MFTGGQSDPWTQADQIARQIASENGAEGNVDPLSRSLVEDLSRVAELQLAKVESLPSNAKLVFNTVTRTEWASESLATYRPFFERFGEAIGSVPADTQAEDPLTQMLSQVVSSLGPMMVSSSAGSMLGHMALHTLGQYDLPVPRPGDELLVVPANLDSLANQAGVPAEEVYLWVLIRESLMHTIFNIEHIRNRVESLLIDFAAAFTPNIQQIESQFGDITSIEDLSGMDTDFQSADSVLSMMRSPSHDLLVPQISAVIAPILGFVDYTMEKLSDGLIPSHPKIATAVHASQSEENEADIFMAQLLGLDLAGNLAASGKAFVEGVLKRAGEEGLSRLWADELDLPTSPEIAAPGLWLERIGFGSDESSMFEIPDDISELDNLDD